MMLLHAGAPLLPHDLWNAWTFDPLVVLGIATSGLLYWNGVRNLWTRAGKGRGISVTQRNWFIAGWVMLVVALISPLHALGAVLFSAHMTQHELLMVVAAPMLVLGEPSVAFAWGLPVSWRRPVTRARISRMASGVWQQLSVPAGALVVHIIVLFAWHFPLLYQATLRNDAVHAAQHTSFLVSALAFWWGLLRARSNSRGSAVVFLFVAMVATGLLGAFLTFSDVIWYPAYVATTAPWGMTALDDQRVGGAIMWIPGGLSYLIAALWLLAVSLREPRQVASSSDGEDMGAAANKSVAHDIPAVHHL